MRGKKTAFGKTLLSLAALGVVLTSSPAAAYIGPGAGFAFLGSFFVFFLVFLLAGGLFLTWPLRFAWRRITGRKTYQGADGRPDRVIVVGLDGLCPQRCRTMMDAGELPNLDALRKEGFFTELQTTNPPISPVAWSSFQTGSNPGRHNIFDFLTPDRGTYLPLLSSAHIGDPRRTLKLGKYRIPLSKPELRLLRKSKPFWTVLGENRVFSTILRVPITFPPEKFNGLSLSAMCVPDLRGTQGTFTYFTDDPRAASVYAGGVISPIKRNGSVIEAELEGPPNTLKEGEGAMKLPLTIEPNGDSALVTIGDERMKLEVGRATDWIKVEFKAGLGVKVSGLLRMCLRSLDSPFGLYVSPINVNPDAPALPISHPSYYSSYLAKKYGPYATLGLAEDTWGLNERVLDEDAFLEQCWRHHAERETMLMDAMDHTRYGCVVCVFDTTDRIQHMFMRYADEKHPANRDKDTETHKDALGELYRRCDETVGRVMKKLGPRDVLIVMSDHGFRSFRRGINLNSWLYKEGYLALKEGKSESGEWFADVDWERTRAYSLGLAGIFINKLGREKKGAVPAEEAEKTAVEIAGRLKGLVDPETGETAVINAYTARQIYSGPYVENAPDVVIGYADGYRASWDGVTGVVNDVVFEDNTKSWSGDHCIDPSLVPGSFFCNRTLNSGEVRMTDVAPTILGMFGIAKPAYMDGTAHRVEIERRSEAAKDGE